MKPIIRNRSREMKGKPVYSPPMESSEISNLNDVREMFAREIEEGTFLKGIPRLVERSSYQPVTVTEESRRISAETFI